MATKRQLPDRLPPHSIEAEQGVLGCILLDPNVLPIAVEKLHSNPARFYDSRHQTLFSILLNQWNDRKPIDILTIHTLLSDKKKLEEIGGLAYLMSLPDMVPSAANIDYYLSIVNDKHLLRLIIQTCTTSVGKIYEHEGDIDALIDDIQRRLTQITNSRYTSKSPEIRDAVHASIAEMEWALEHRGQLKGLPSGFADLDKLTLGLHNGELFVLAARPSVGKTALSMNIVEHLAIGMKIPCGVFSLEMSAKALVTRMISSQSKVNIRDIYSGCITEMEFPKLTSAGGRVAGAPIYIEDTRGINTLELRAKARRMKQEHDIKFLVVDYIQLLHPPRSRDSREQEISDISNALKSLAGELDIPVLGLSQLNREMDKDGRTPRLSDLRGSGALEQDGDTIALLYNKAHEDDHDHGRRSPITVVGCIIAKQRHGPCDEIELGFLKRFTRFENMARLPDLDMDTQQQKLPYADP